MYRVRLRFIACISQKVEVEYASRNEVRGGRDTSGPYDYPYFNLHIKKD